MVKNIQRIDCLINSSLPDGSFHISFLINGTIVLYVERNMFDNEYKGKVIYNAELNINTYINDFKDSLFNKEEYITYNNFNLVKEVEEDIKYFSSEANKVREYVSKNPIEIDAAKQIATALLNSYGDETKVLLNGEWIENV